MKKIKVNPRVMKKVILFSLLGLVVIILGYAVVSSFISSEITTLSRDLTVEIPAGDYRDYILEKIEMEKDYFDDSNEAIMEEFETKLNNKMPSLTAPIKQSYKDIDKELSYGYDEVKYDFDGDDVLETAGYKTEDDGQLVWNFDVEEAGFYYILVDFVVHSDSNKSGSNAERAIYVNNELQYNALGSMQFHRIYRDSEEAREYYALNGELQTDLNGNNIKPSQEEVRNVRREEYLFDATGYVRNPYLIYLNKGSNEITFKSIREKLTIFNVSVCQTADYDVPYYEDYVKEMEAQGATEAKDFSQTYQAEDSLIRTSSSPTLYPISDRNSSANTPSDPVLQKYNAVGGSKWSNAGDYLEWEIEVPTSGFYYIAFRAKQDLARGLFTTRKLFVNGEVPFKEAENCRFFYDSGYSIIKLGDEEGNVFKVYLHGKDQGTNTIRMQATVGDYSDLISQVQLVGDDLNDLYLRIISITTANPDDYQDYNLLNRLGKDEKDRDLIKILSESAKTLDKVSKKLAEITGEKSTFNNTLDKLVLQIGEDGGFASNYRNVTKDLAAFKTNLSALGTWVLDIKNQSLTIESFTVYTADQESELPKSEDNIFSSLWYDIKGFFLSFFFDYESVGVTQASTGNDLEVWFLSDVSSGREQCNAIKSLIDQTFTPASGINVILKIVAPGVLLPATLAGTGPDVAINVDGGLPVNYALRGAVYDMSQQPDYEEVVKERFTEQQMVPFELLHPDTTTGVYGLPNTMSFYVMFYRTDIFEKNSWSVPRTWDEVIDLVTDMQVSNLQFYMPLEGDGGTMFATLLYQSIDYEKDDSAENPYGEYYAEDRSTSVLNKEVSLKAFEQWCSFFTDYSFELAANFSNRFRSGEMPIGISSYTLFNTLAVFAPDIAGKWAFAPLPGQVITPDDPSTPEDELVVNNTTILGQTAVVIMKDSDQYDESWEFVKWWTETETQAMYAKEMESILGSAARHNTANRYAIEELAWTKAELNVITEMWDTAVGIPGVPGGYYIGRNLENSIRAVINNDANPRETFKEYIEQINSEIKRKRIEFGFEKED